MPGLTVPHLIDLGEDRDLVGARLGDSTSWDALRTETSGAYALPTTREDWEASADERPEIGERMRALAQWLSSEGVESVGSYGVGAALPELWLARAAPALRLTVTEYAPATVDRLQTLFTEAEVVQHDLLADPPLPAQIHLFHRVDTELNHRQWRVVFRRYAGERIVFVAAEVYEWRRLPQELRQLWARRGWTRSGYQRTRGALKALWRPTHRANALQLGDLEAWVLEPRG